MSLTYFYSVSIYLELLDNQGFEVVRSIGLEPTTPTMSR